MYTNNTNGKLVLTKEQLDEVMSFCSKKIVGKVLKRLEIHNNIAVLKNEIRELLYESYRDTADLIYASGKGLGLTQFNFNNSEKTGKTDSVSQRG